VHIFHNGHQHDSTIHSLVPSLSGQPFMLARVILKNDSDSEFFHYLQPGDVISADIDAEKIEVPLLVDNRALQQLEGNTVVFIANNDQYQARVVRVGRQDDNSAEILAGLNPGERYVVENSYLIKADIGKSEAAHEH
jgi:cobalt-zinc-cadmium efflux system membrane fusion protein